MAHVLVVDDDADTRDVLASLLRKRGYEVTAAPNGRDALAEVTREHAPNLVVLDLRMPEMDGVMFLQILRSYLRLQSLPVMLVTAYPESPDVGRAQKLGVIDVFKKSGGFDPLLDAIDRHFADAAGESAGA
jgi:CheY-like chemotaxis protein